MRQTIELSKFGFLQNGILSVNISDMVVQGSHGTSKDVIVSIVWFLEPDNKVKMSSNND